MSIHFIGGKPGGGKTLHATHLIIDILRDSERNVVTNVPLDLDRLQEYVNTWSSPYLVSDRVRILDEDEMPEFYRYRGPDILLSKKLDGEVDYSSVSNSSGVAYFLDELHIFFNSRAWKNTGAGALFYLSQHRKLGDVVYCITQAISNVDKQFRSVAQDFSYVENHRTQSFRGFRRGSGFRVKSFLQPATGSLDVPFEVRDFPLNKQIAECYNTSAGVGMPGGSADKGSKAKGFPLWIIWGVLPLGLLLIFGILQGIQRAFRLSKPESESAPAVSVGGLDLSSPSSASSRPLGSSSSVVSSSADLLERLQEKRAMTSGPHDQDEPWPVGVVVASRGVVVVMSDGTARSSDEVDEVLTGGRVRFRGDPRLHRVRPAPVISAGSSRGSEVDFLSVLADLPSENNVGMIADAPVWSADTGPIGRPSGQIGR